MWDQQPVVFVLPEGSECISGGNLYNESLICALRDSFDLRCIGVEEWKSSPPKPGLYFVDTLNLNEFADVSARRVMGQRFVLLVHHLAGLEPGLAADDPRVIYEQSLLPKFDGYIATSEYAAQVIRSYGLESRIVVLQPPIVDDIEPDTTRKCLAPTCALMACNLIPRKGVLEFLEELATYSRDDDLFSLDIVGRVDLDSAYSARCMQVMSEHPGLQSRVRMHGAVEHSKMRGWYSNANLFLSASKMETFGISLQEARFYGLPIFAVKGGNSSNHVSCGITGELFDDPAALARGFVRLIRTDDQSSLGAKSLHSYFTEAQRGSFEPMDTWAELAKRLHGTLTDWFSEK